MSKHKKKILVVEVPSQHQQQQLLPEQKNEQELNELLQVYAPDRREAMREKILQRRNNNKNQIK